MSSAADLRAGSEARRQGAMARMAGLAVQRNQFNLDQQRKMEEEAAAVQRQAEEAQNEGSRNWLNSTASMGLAGAGIGSMIGGPGMGTAVGAAIGGTAGFLAGVGGSYKNRRDNGSSRLGALGKSIAHPFGDKYSGMQDMPVMGAMMPPPPGAINSPQAKSLASQAKQLEAWRNQQASRGMAGSVSSASAPLAPGMGQAYGAAYSQPAAPAAPPMVGPRAYAYNPAYDTNAYWNQ